jgi:hypothetical protein
LEELAQLVLGILETGALGNRQSLAGAIDVKIAIAERNGSDLRLC